MYFLPGVYFTTIECVFYVYFTTIKIRIPTRTKRTNTVLEAEKCRSEWWEADLFRPRRVDPKQWQSSEAEAGSKPLKAPQWVEPAFSSRGLEGVWS